MSSRPISEKRLAANRANAARSTGPRTPEGKLHSAQNSRKHGFTASKFTIAGVEDHDSLENLRADAIAACQPIDSHEFFAVERIALAQLTLLRCARFEANVLTSAMKLQSDDDQASPDPFSLAHGLQSNPESFKLLLRYQAQAERLYRRAVEEFERLKAQRPELPNEPIPEPEYVEEEPEPSPKRDNWTPRDPSVQRLAPNGPKLL